MKFILYRQKFFSSKINFSKQVFFTTFAAQNFYSMANLLVLGLLGGMGAPEIIIILVIILLLFGGKKIPELMRGLGRGVKEFKDAAKGESKEDDKQ